MELYPCSHMFRSAYDFTSYFCPVYTVIQLFVYKSADRDIVASNKVQAMTDHRAGLRVVCRSYDTLDRFVQDDVRQLIARE